MDQKVAVSTEAYDIAGERRYEQIIKGWSGAGFDSSFRSVTGSFIHAAGVAIIKFEVVDTIGKRRYSKMGSITLSEEDALDFARAVAPDTYSKVYKANKELAERNAALLSALQEMMPFARLHGSPAHLAKLEALLTPADDSH